MENNYEVPELTLIGDASEVVMGIAFIGLDSHGQNTTSDFEFEQD